MKVFLYAGDLNLDKKYETNVEIQKFDFLGNETLKTFILSSPNVL